MPKNPSCIEYIIKEPAENRGNTSKLGQTSGSWEGNELGTLQVFGKKSAVTEFLYYLLGAALHTLLEFSPVFQRLPQRQVISVFQFSAKRQATSQARDSNAQRRNKPL